MAQVTGTIQVTSASMLGAHGTINGHLQGIEDGVTGIKNTITQLIGNGEWKGGAALAAQELHATLHAKHMEINQAVQTFNNNIKIANTNYSDLDTQIQRGFTV